jgi:hypothetical protein
VLALLAGLLASAGLVHLAVTGPARRAASEQKQLDRLCLVPDDGLSLDMAEDGVVLARRHGKSKEEARFLRAAEKLKRGGRRA